MPELAETLRISTDLSDLKLGKVQSIVVEDDRCFEKGVLNKLVAKPMDCVARWMGAGKYVALVLCDATIMTFRLGMSGRFVASHFMNEVDKKHVILRIKCENGTVNYVDYRKFSRINIISDLEFREINKYTLLYSYESEWNPNDFKTMPVTKKPKITEMLDEGTITGIGNYLANETLGLLDFNPYTPFKDLEEKQKAYTFARMVATNSYREGGNTFNGGYKRVNGQIGNFRTKIYGEQSFRQEKFRGRPIFTRFTKT